MDAAEFLKEQYRMCKALNSHCEECGLSYTNNKTDHVCGDFIKRHPEEAVAIVEKWAKEHPKKTRQSEFLKMFPNAFVYLGSVDIDPCKIVKSKYDTEQCKLRGTSEWGCENCREQFWHEEVE